MMRKKIKTFIKEEYGEEYNIDSFSRIKIEEINVNIKPFNTYAQTCPNVATINHSDNIDENFAKKIKKSIWAVSQKLDFNEILFFSYKIILKYRHVRFLLNSLFPYVFIDEYQDTNPIQNSLIKQFADNKNVVLGVIGDAAQSIYHFQSADYREFEQFKTNNKELVEYVINGNRRSTSNIIHFLNYLRKTDLNLDKQDCKKNTNNDKVHFLIRKNKSAIIINHIKEPETLTVLCRRWADVFQYVTGLDQDQQSIINSIQGHYTYQLKRDFFTEIEQHKINWIKASSFVVSIRKALKQKSLAKAIQISNEYFDMNFLINSNKNQATIYESWIKFIKIIEKINEDDDLEKIVDELAKNCLSVKLPLLEDFSIYKNEEDAENPIFLKIKKIKFSTLCKMFNEIFAEDGKYKTIHRSKGKEYDRVLVNITPAKDEKDITSPLKALTNPTIFDHKIDNIETEYNRLIYVGCSRAINELYICIDGNEESERQLNNSLNVYKNENNIKDDFYDITII